MKKLSLVYVEWDDHHFASHWQTEGEIVNSPAKCHSVGWILKEDDIGLTIIGTCTDDGDVGNAQYILKGCITKRKDLRVLKSGVSQKKDS